MLKNRLIDLKYVKRLKFSIRWNQINLKLNSNSNLRWDRKSEKNIF